MYCATQTGQLMENDAFPEYIPCILSVNNV